MTEAQDWIEYIADCVYQYYCGRKVVLWGKYIESDNIKDMLAKKYHINTAFYVDSDIEKVDNREVFSTDVLRDRSTEYYVVIPLAIYQSVRDILLESGYKADKDYCYFSDCVLSEEEDYYEDVHGNKIIGNRQGVKFAFSGFHSKIQIGKNVRFHNSNIYCHNNSQIVIGDNATIKEVNIHVYDDSKIVVGDSVEILATNLDIKKDTQIVLGNNIRMQDCGIYLSDKAECKIGCQCKWNNVDVATVGTDAKIVIGDMVEFRGSKEHKLHWSMLYNSRLDIRDQGIFKYGNLHLKENSMLRIGSEFTIEGGYYICADSDTFIAIGDDCMFSSDILLKSNDGHSIFDIVTGENINSTDDIRNSRKLVIGNHVWVGMRSVILYNTLIEDGSIVGAMSMVKCRIPNNCMAAGVPARIIRKNIAWSREEGAMDILLCGQEYVHLTEEGKE